MVSSIVSAVDSITLISTRPGAVRGNPYHKHTIQYLYLLSGRLNYYSQRRDQEVEIAEVETGMIVCGEMPVAVDLKARRCSR